MRLPELPESRLKFFLPRLTVSLVLIAAFWAVIRFGWYPGPYFELAGTLRLILIVAIFALLVGPALTVLVYKCDKKGMWGDIAILTVVELVALGIAGSVIHERRPAYLVFAVDRFEIVSPREVDTALIGYPELRRVGIETLVAAKLPDDYKLAEPIVDDIIFNGGVDIDRRPALWEPFESSAGEAAGRSGPLSALAANDADAQLEHWLAGREESAGDFGFLPLRGLKGDATMIVDERGYPVAVLDIDPWLD